MDLCINRGAGNNVTIWAFNIHRYFTPTQSCHTCCVHICSLLITTEALVTWKYCPSKLIHETFICASCQVQAALWYSWSKCMWMTGRRCDNKATTRRMHLSKDSRKEGALLGNVRYLMIGIKGNKKTGRREQPLPEGGCAFKNSLRCN